MAQRWQELEDTFKIDLSVKPGEREVKMDEVTPLWEETMLKAWQHYLGLCHWVQGSPGSPGRAPSTSLSPSSFGVGFASRNPRESWLIEGEGKTRDANQVRDSRNLLDGRAATSGSPGAALGGLGPALTVTRALSCPDSAATRALVPASSKWKCSSQRY